MKNNKLRSLCAIAALSSVAALGGCVIIASGDDAHVHTSFDGGGVTGNGELTREARQVTPADALEVNGSVSVVVSMGSANTLEVEGDSNLLPLLKTEVRDGVLKVRVDGGFHTRNALRVRYTTTALRSITVNSSGSVEATALQNDNLAVQVNGSGSVRLEGAGNNLDLRSRGSGSIDASSYRTARANVKMSASGGISMGLSNCTQLTAEILGSGSLKASGSVRQLTASVHGSGSADLRQLTAESAELFSYGSGSISAAVTRALEANASASGSIRVYGNPQQSKISGRNVHIVS
ncbi:head GIN domain-containing protein [Undibacterium sp. TJN25]|uniref:head GIN domain-containing protein n=1 Tax=Undibacterium sp. TJN25 TaxID=3413056 RepID=UPI003BF172D1